MREGIVVSKVSFDIMHHCGNLHLHLLTAIPTEFAVWPVGLEPLSLNVMVLMYALLLFCHTWRL